jgi:hypothetical protein
MDTSNYSMQQRTGSSKVYQKNYQEDQQYTTN